MTIVNWNRFGKKTVLEGCQDDTLKWIYSAQPNRYEYPFHEKKTLSPA